MQEGELKFASIINALADDKTSNVEACERLTALATVFRSMGAEEQDAVFNQDHADDMQQLVDAMFMRIQLLESEEHGVDAELQGRTLAAMLRLMPMGGITSELARCLFMRGFHGILGVILDGLFELPHLQDSVESQQLLCLLLQAFTDLAEAQWTEPGERKPRTGRDDIGNTVMEKLLTYMPQTKYMTVSVRRGAATLLLALIMRSKSNQALLGAFDRKCSHVFNDFLASCGDYTTQLDIMEALYRCCKGDMPDAVDRYIAFPEVQEKFKKLLAKTSKAVDLALELREILVLFNKTLARPSVHPFKASSIQYVVPGGPTLDMVRPASMWADVGNNQVTCYAAIFDQAPAGDAPASDVPEEPLDFEFNNLRTAKVSDVKDRPGMCEVELTMQQRPAVLEGHPALPDGDMLFRLVMLADKTVAAPLLHHLPRAAIRIASQDPEFLDLTQPAPGKRRVKMSMGIPAQAVSTVTTKDAPSGLSHKAPLPLRPTPARQAALSASFAAAASGLPTDAAATTTHGPTHDAAVVTAARCDDEQQEDDPARSLQPELGQATPGSGQQTSEPAHNSHADKHAAGPGKTQKAAPAQPLQQKPKPKQKRQPVAAAADVAEDADVESGPVQAKAAVKQPHVPVAKPQAGRNRKDRKAAAEERSAAQQEQSQLPAPRRRTRASLSTAGSPLRAAEEPAAKQPAADAVTDVGQADKPIVEKPTTDKPTTDKPAAAGSVSKLAADKPAADRRAADKPAADRCAADKPAAEKLAKGTPAVVSKPADKPTTSRQTTSRKRGGQIAAPSVQGQEGKKQKVDVQMVESTKPAAGNKKCDKPTDASAVLEPVPAPAPAPEPTNTDADGPSSDPAWLAEAAVAAKTAAPPPAGKLVTDAVLPSPSPSAFTRTQSHKQQNHQGGEQEVAPVAADAVKRPVVAATPTHAAKTTSATQQRAASAQKRTPKVNRLAALGAASPSVQRGTAGVIKPRAGSQPLLPPKPGAAKPKAGKNNTQAATPPRASQVAVANRSASLPAASREPSVTPQPAAATVTAPTVVSAMDPVPVAAATVCGPVPAPTSTYPTASAGPAAAAMPVAPGTSKPPKPAAAAASKSKAGKKAATAQQQKGDQRKDTLGAEQECVNASLDAIEASLPVPSRALLSKKLKAYVMRAGSVDEIEDPDASLMSPLANHRKVAVSNKRTTKRQRTPPNDGAVDAATGAQEEAQPAGKRPRRAASTKAAQAIRQQADEHEGSIFTQQQQQQQQQQVLSKAAAKVGKPAPISATAAVTTATAPSAAKAAVPAVPSIWAFSDDDVPAAGGGSALNKPKQKQASEQLAPAAAGSSDEEAELAAVATLAPPPSPADTLKPAHVTVSSARQVSAQPAAVRAMSQAAVQLQQDFAAIDQEMMVEEDEPGKGGPASAEAVVAAAQAAIAQLTKSKTCGHVSTAPEVSTSPPHAVPHVLARDVMAFPGLPNADHDPLDTDVRGLGLGLTQPARGRGSGRDGKGGRGGSRAGQGTSAGRGRGRGGPAAGNTRNQPSKQTPDDKYLADHVQPDSGQSPLDQLVHGSNADEMDCDMCNDLMSGGAPKTLPSLTGTLLGLPAAPQQTTTRAALSGLPGLSLHSHREPSARTASALKPLSTSAAAGKSMAKAGNNARSRMADLEMMDEEPTTLISQLMQALTGGDDDGGEEEAALLQTALLRMMTSKKQQLKAKQAAIIQDAQQRIKQEACELEAKLAKEARSHAALATRTMKALQEQLDNKMNDIAMLQAEFEKTVSSAWDEYVQLYNQLGTAKREIEKLGERHRAAAQKQVAVLKQQADGILADAAARAQQLTSKTNIMPGLSRLLRSIETML